MSVTPEPASGTSGLALGRALLLIGAAVAIGLLQLRASHDSSGEVGIVTGRRPATTAAGTAGSGATGSSNTTAPSSTSAATRPSRPPSQVKVLALNATRTAGVGGRISDLLESKGYPVLPPARATGAPAPSSAVYFVPGSEAEAGAVAGILGLPATSVQPLPSPPPVRRVGEAQVVVLGGVDLAERGRAIESTTTTTTAKAG